MTEIYKLTNLIRVTVTLKGCITSVTTFFLYIFATSLALRAQTTQQEQPSNIALKRWDDAFVTSFDNAIIGCFLVTIVIGLTIGLFVGRRYWWGTAPRLRIVFVSIGVWILVMILGVFAYFNLDPLYLQWAEAKQFGAQGLLWGMINAGVAAISQLWLMPLLLAAACTLGGVVTLILSELLWRRTGLWSKVKGESL